MSKNESAPLIGFQPVELEILGQSTAEPPEPRQEFPSTGRLADLDVRLPAAWISMLSPSFRSRASTTDAGSRIAKLLPHLETRMCEQAWFSFIGVHSVARARMERSMD